MQSDRTARKPQVLASKLTHYGKIFPAQNLPCPGFASQARPVSVKPYFHPAPLTNPLHPQRAWLPCKTPTKSALLLAYGRPCNCLHLASLPLLACRQDLASCGQIPSAAAIVVRPTRRSLHAGVCAGIGAGYQLVTGANGSSSPSSFVAVGGITFFTAATPKMALNSGKRTARVRGPSWSATSVRALTVLTRVL